MKNKLTVVLKARIVFFLYRIINFLLYATSSIIWFSQSKLNPRKICIYRIGNIGDIICAIPAIIAIRSAYPRAHITFLTSPGPKGAIGAKELIEGAWFLDRLWLYYSDDVDTLAKTIQLIKKLRHENFDLWITLPAEMWNIRNILTNMLFAKLCRAKSACGFLISTIRLWAVEQSKLNKFDNEVQRLLNVLNYYRIPISQEVVYDLPIPSGVQESAQKILNRYQLTDSHIFGFVPGAKRTINEWPLDHFVETAKYLIHRFPESKIVIFGGVHDSQKGEYIENKLDNNHVINLTGQTSLLELAYLLKHLDLIISNNTGPMHMAALGARKVIAIFSCAELYGKWFPYGNNASVMIKRSDCEGCYYTCGNDGRCIKEIKPHDILRLVDASVC
jgi:ADP-heptose:LPS heptosyltransferase